MGALVPVLLVVALAAAAGGAGGRRKRSGAIAPSAEPCPPGFITLPDGDCLPPECDPMDPSTWSPGTMCVLDDMGFPELVPADDPAQPAAIDYGPLQSEEGVRRALAILGHDSPDLRIAVADFQTHLLDIFGLSSGEDVRTDGRLDQNTLEWILTALAYYQNDDWLSPQEWAAREQEAKIEELEEDPVSYMDVLAANEDANVGIILNAWGPDEGWTPGGGGWPMRRNDLTAFWFFDSNSNTPDAEAQSGETFSAWLTNLVYWGTYANFAEAPAPRSLYPVPLTARWDAEEPYRTAWLRIHEKVKQAMASAGIVDSVFDF